MSSICSSALDLIGSTPLVALSRISPPSGGLVLGKLESRNPSGSAKDRAALAMVRDAETRGLLAPGAVIIEPTSGNTGIGLAWIAALRGYRCVIVMPDSMSQERQMLLRAYGAEVVLTPGRLGISGAMDAAKKLAAKTPNSFIPDQFRNPANPAAHYGTTGPEIWVQAGGNIDFFVAGTGTGGTLTGAGRYLKEQSPGVKLVAVEPAASQVLSGRKPGAHGLQGIGPNFIPEILDTALIDEIIPVTEAQAFAAGRLLARREGILAGISSGAALHAALTLAQRPENRGKRIAALLPDSGERYLSTGLFD